MPEHTGSYAHFLEWCEGQDDDLAKKAVVIARNRDNTNRTGHIVRGYLASVQFLKQDSWSREWLGKLPGNRPVGARDSGYEGFLDRWLRFLQGNSAQHAILRRILPRSLGGATTTGGGAGYPFRLALRLTADYLAQGHAQPGDRDIPAKYRMIRRREFDRDHPAVNDLKKHYNYACQVCGSRIDLGGGRYYCEGHHLRPLGRSHNGRADTTNVIIVCPNHHAEFDHFLFAILDVRGKYRRLEHMYRDLAAREQRLRVSHRIAPENLDYVIEQFLTRMDLYFTA